MFTASRNSCCFFLSTEGLLSGKLLKICSRQAQINAEVLLEASNAGKWFAIRLQKILFRDYCSFFSSKYAHSKQKFVLLLCSFSLRGCQKNCWRQTERRNCARLLMLEGVCFLENLTENMLRTSGKQCWSCARFFYRMKDYCWKYAPYKRKEMLKLCSLFLISWGIILEHLAENMLHTSVKECWSCARFFLWRGFSRKSCWKYAPNKQC